MSCSDWLKEENREIVKIVGDGNCLYRCFSYIEYGTEDRHQDIRKLISDSLSKIVNEPNNLVKLSPDYWLQERKNMTEEDNIIRILFLLCDLSGMNKDEILPFLNNVSLKISVMAPPNDNNDDRLKKYGGTLDIIIFSYITQKCLYTLQNIPDKKNSYKWHLTSIQFKMQSVQNLNYS